jgi:hypothetical protein
MRRIWHVRKGVVVTLDSILRTLYIIQIRGKRLFVDADGPLVVDGIPSPQGLRNPFSDLRLRASAGSTPCLHRAQTRSVRHIETAGPRL